MNPEDMAIQIRGLIREPLSRYLTALAAAFKDESDSDEYADIRHGTADSLRNTLEGMVEILNPKNHAVQSLGMKSILEATSARFRAPVHYINRPVSGVSDEDRNPLIRALEEAANMIDSHIPKQLDIEDNIER